MNTKAFCPIITRGQSSENFAVEQIELLLFLWQISVDTKGEKNGDLPPIMLLNSFLQKKNWSYYKIYFPYSFSGRQLEHLNKRELCGLVESISLYEYHGKAQIFREKEIVSLDIWSLNPPHSGHYREVITIFGLISETKEGNSFFLSCPLSPFILPRWELSSRVVSLGWIHFR